MRPTIPLADWRIAVDLDASRRITELPGREAVGCDCQSCRNWRAAYAEVLPVELRSQLERFGIDPAVPSDLYQAGREPLRYRVIYHCVGRILSGPARTVEGKAVADGPNDPPVIFSNYVTLAAAARWLAITVLYERDAIGPQQRWVTPEVQPLIRVDLRLDMPWRLSEPQQLPYGEVRRRSSVGPQGIR